MACAATKKLVVKVLQMKIAKMTNMEIQSALVRFGVPVSMAPQVVDSVLLGYKSGTMASFTGGRSAQRIEFGKNEIFDIAFNRGRREMRLASIPWRKILPAGLVIIFVLLALVWFSRR
jgi:hypothetical protein